MKKSPAALAPFVSIRVYGRELHTCHSVQCQDCGALFSDTRFNDGQARKLYAGYRDAQYTAERVKYELGYTNPSPHDYIPEVEAFLRGYLPPSGYVLDWGGGDGDNTPFKDHFPAIYDINTAPYFAPGQFDLIICSNLLEHVAYPVKTLEEMKSHTCGIIYLEIPMGPVTDYAYLDKRQWHEHITFFTEKSTEMMLRRARLRVVDYKRHHLAGMKYYTYLFMIACEVDNANNN